MKMIGMSIRSAVTSFWSSSPFRSGSPTSSTRQLGARTRGRSRNSCADGNVCGCQPAESIKSSSDSRTETSSSTTNTIGVVSGMEKSSGSAKRGPERVQQSGPAEWLEQTRHRAPLDETGTNALIRVRSDEHDGDLLPATGQFPLEIGSAHARHGHVQDEASGLVEAIGRQELFCRCKRPGREAELQQQV